MELRPLVEVRRRLEVRRRSGDAVLSRSSSGTRIARRRRRLQHFRRLVFGLGVLGALDPCEVGFRDPLAADPLGPDRDRVDPGLRDQDRMRLVIDRAPDVELEVHRVVSDGRVAEFLDDRLPVALDLSRLLLRSEGRDYVRLETDDRLDEGVVRGAPLRPSGPCVALHRRRRAVDHAENALPFVRR